MRARLARWRAYWRATGTTSRWQLVGVYALVVGACFIGFTSIGNSADKATNAAEQAKSAAASAQDAAHQAQTAIADVQQQRKDVCKDQNQHHDNTIRQLRLLVADVVKNHPEQAAQAKESIQQNISLIDALAPVKNCATITTNP